MSGYGGSFSGGKAQLRLAPSTTVTGPPTGAHSVGELFVDKPGKLYYCTKGSTATTAATWRQVSLS